MFIFTTVGVKVLCDDHRIPFISELILPSVRLLFKYWNDVWRPKNCFMPFISEFILSSLRLGLKYWNSVWRPKDYFIPYFRINFIFHTVGVQVLESCMTSKSLLYSLYFKIHFIFTTVDVEVLKCCVTTRGLFYSLYFRMSLSSLRLVLICCSMFEIKMISAIQDVFLFPTKPLWRSEDQY